MRIISAIAIQAAIAMDKAHLYREAQTEIKRREGVENALRENEQRLESRVEERTAQLIAANAELKEEAERRLHAEGRFKVLVEGATRVEVKTYTRTDDFYEADAEVIADEEIFAGNLRHSVLWTAAISNRGLEQQA